MSDTESVGPGKPAGAALPPGSGAESVLNAAPTLIVFNRAGVVLTASEAMHRRLGYPTGELAGRSIGEVFVEQSGERFAALFERPDRVAGRSEVTWRGRQRHRDGTLVEVEATLFRVDTPGSLAFLAVLRSQDDALAAAGKREADDRYRQVAELASHYAYSACLADSHHVSYDWVVGDYEAITGYRAEELARLGWKYLIHPGDWQRVQDALARLQDGMQVDCEFRILTRGGQTRWLREVFKPLEVSRDPFRLKLIGATTDITDRKLAELETARERRVADAMMNLMPGLVFLLNSEGRLMRWNEPLEQIVRLPAGELLGQRLTDVFEPDNAESWRQAWEGLGREGQSSFVLVFRSEDPEGVPHLCQVRGIQIDGQQVYLGAAVDLSEQARREAERQTQEVRRQQAAKLESLTLLSAGVAHDFNNVLTTMLGYLDLLRGELAEDSPGQELVDLAEQSARRAEELCNQLMGYAGKTTLKREPVDLSALLADLLPMWTSSAPERIRFEMKAAEGLPRFTGDATQLRQMLMNLVQNAIDSLGHGVGTISIHTKLLGRDDPRLRQNEVPESLRESGGVCVEVADTGPGIPEDVMSRMFEPFFTTKKSGNGIGLASTLGIVRGHRGAIWIESVVGEGTRFVVCFPVDAPGLKRTPEGRRL